ncbi:uncharacterized protein LOC113204505 isoform X3 [Frankliniella occidentalis]|uniref:Uncharacterized protein LOC113204505 isoform X3 n=1 Tax=Frankliniella occidentalis TaxID=133901 RepID=A0A9C6U0A9_FRAOC|nr:uncharacterized protein LOC113204505 isoform X3 [Frankliniella occidentalis]
MQIWSWLLAAALLACTASARPEGSPVDAAQQPQQPEQPADLPRAEADSMPKEGAEIKPETKPDVVPDEPKIDKEEEDAMKPNPVPIEPDVMTPDDSKVFPEGSLRSPIAFAVVDGSVDDSRVIGEKPDLPLIPVQSAVEGALSQAGPAQKEDAEKEEKTPVRSTRTARTYLPAEARGAEDGIELNLSPGTVLVPYYGGAKGQYLIIAKPVTAAELAVKNKKKNNKKKPARPGHKEEEEEEENVGEETDEKPPSPPADTGDTITISQPPPNASMAEAKPIGIAVAGEGGVASSRPTATALVGPGGLAVARPIATAIAGIQGAELLVAAAVGGAQVAPAGPVAAFLYPGVPAGLGAPWGPQPQAQPLQSLHHLHPLAQPLAQPLLPPTAPHAQWLLLPPPYHYA